MLYKREGLPQEGEVVLCTVARINPNSIFANINDYDKQGMIHISEISPGRIRNIRDYVVEGKTIVCKVLAINRERGHIDLSLRRVNETLRRNKLNEVKQEQKAEKIIELISQAHKKEMKKVYEEIAKPILENYEMVYIAFTDVASEKLKTDDLNIPAEYKKELVELVGKRFRPEKIPVGGILKIQTYAADGVSVLKDALKQVENLKNSKVVYLGAGAFKISIDSEDAKTDEKALDKKIAEVIEFMEKHEGTGSFIKEAAEE
ncbi:S1 RNA-binding domain-containing protein [Candidatus Woesearchaeota archaeon]|nr:S1 RNA-binding domain-containing protein [Candidatus Woesearchaeota archaeon]